MREGNSNGWGKARITAVASCFPPNYIHQQEITEMLLRLWPLSEQNADRLRKFHENVEVNGRYLALPMEAYQGLSGFGARNDAWTKAALELGEATSTALLEKAGIGADEISVLASTTITGIAVPSLEARLMNRLPFPRNMKRMPFFGYGCLGGAAGIARLADYLEGHPDETAILLSVNCAL
jgi:alkylresorcinol/alkylpyrone synthase